MADLIIPRRRNRLRHPSPSLIVGTAMGVILILVAIIAPAALGEHATTLGVPRQDPGADHLLGTDALGRDIFARSLVATRLTLLMAAGSTLIAVSCGILIGGSIWLGPRQLREGVLRIIDATVAFPSLVLALIIAAILGAGTSSAVTAIGVASVPSFTRLVSNMLASVTQRDFVSAAKLLGVPGYAMFARHLLPNIAGPLLVLATGSFALALLEISSLSFVGLGVQNPHFDYGLLLSDGLTAIYTQPWQAIAPSVMLIYAGVTAMLLGDGLAQTLHPVFRRHKAVRATTPQTQRTPQKHTPAPSTALVQVDQLQVFAPDGSELVKGVSFTIRAGEILGLVGESGSGKSMTAMALAHLLADGVQAQAASLRIDNLDLRTSQPPQRLATEVGLVYQDPGTTFNPALRMGPQLTEVARLHLGLPRSKAETMLTSALTQIRVPDAAERIRQHSFQWSGGMLQRATIASAMCSDPKLIIADEPTTALDVTVQAEVLRQFKRVNREQGTAMLFISHDIDVVQQLCDTILVMYDGEVVERLTKAQLSAGEVSHPYTRRLISASPRLDDPLPVRHVPAPGDALVSRGGPDA